MGWQIHGYLKFVHRIRRSTADETLWPVRYVTESEIDFLLHNIRANECYDSKRGDLGIRFRGFNDQRENMTLEITEDELADARKNWGNALVEISKAFETEGVNAARAVASRALDTVYGFDLGQVLFKPTLASGKQTFRTTRNGALATLLVTATNIQATKGLVSKVGVP